MTLVVVAGKLTTMAGDLEFTAQTLDAAGVARCMLWRDASVGLTAVLVIDDLSLGPGAGGVRTRVYPSLTAALAEAAGLAQAMTRKCALAGLAAGGAKAVVLAGPELDWPRAFARLGELVTELGGVFRTAGDLGTTADDLAAMASTCPYVHVEERGLAEAVARGLVGCGPHRSPPRSGPESSTSTRCSPRTSMSSRRVPSAG